MNRIGVIIQVVILIFNTSLGQALDKNRSCKTEILDSSVQVKLTGKVVDNVTSVIVLKLKEKPNVLPIEALRQNELGITALTASGANPKRFKNHVFGNFSVKKLGKYEFSLIPVNGK
ncbi:hypothetical protein [Lutibacter sp.]|uniref:hypothetical protein n=1 Tax=Lutibacter sp. TaxID=1925666 RepID=UPI00356A0B78